MLKLVQSLSAKAGDCGLQGGDPQTGFRGATLPFCCALRKGLLAAAAVWGLFLASQGQTHLDPRPDDPPGSFQTAQPTFSFVLEHPARADNANGKPVYYTLSEKGRISFTSRSVRFEGVGSPGALVELDLGEPAALEAINERPGVANFLSGDGQLFSSRLFGGVCYREVSPGVDLCYETNRQGLKSEFRVKPQADPSRIRLRYRGHQELRLRQDGALVISTALGQIVESPPRIFQLRRGRQQSVQGSFRILDHDAVGFELGLYDTGLPLVIDPAILVYSTYLGGEFLDVGLAVVSDASGSAYVLGLTGSFHFPLSGGNEPITADFFLARFAPDGSSLSFITFIGGERTDVPAGLALDGAGNVYIAGYTNSTDFPTTEGAFRRMCNCALGATDSFVMKLDPSGSQLLYSTYFGGRLSEETMGLAVDQQGNAYVTGNTTSDAAFPLLNAFQSQLRGPQDAFVFKLDPSGGRLVYSTYLGSPGQSHRETGMGIAVDAAGRAFVSGRTDSAGFPALNALQASLGGDEDAFVAGFGPTGALLFSTYLGGSGREEFAHIASDAAGNIAVAGDTNSLNFPLRNPLQAELAEAGLGQPDMFISRLTPGGALVFSTYFGGSGRDGGRAVRFDSFSNILVAGDTRSTDLPLVNPVQRELSGGNNDAAVLKLSADGSRLLFSTYLGGFGDDFANDVASDASGAILVCGFTSSNNFPLEKAAQRAMLSMAPEAFLAKLDDDPRRILWFPQVGDGRQGGIGFQTSLFLVNTLGRTDVRLEFFDRQGQPLALDLEGFGRASQFKIPLQEGETLSLGTPGEGALKVGYAKLDAGLAVDATLVFARSDAASQEILYEAGLPPAEPLSQFSVLIDRRGRQKTGLAMVNVGGAAARVNLRLYDSQARLVASNALQLPSGHHLARFAEELFPQVPADLQGSLTVESDRPLAAFTLRQFDGPAEVLLGDPPTLTVFPVIPGRADQAAQTDAQKGLR